LPGSISSFILRDASKGFPSIFIRSAGFVGVKRKILENRLRFGKNFSFPSDFLAVQRSCTRKSANPKK